MAAKKIMIQGTGSHVGKSVITAGLCRYFREEGFRVAPFKAQNMSNNSFVTTEGGEIGRAQAFQAQACGIDPTVDMNPILLKPATDTGAQVVVLGKAVKVMNVREYYKYHPHLIGVIRDSLAKLSERYDIVVIEGAGSPAEINLRPFDIVNMKVARMAQAPVLIVGDISLGGVFAWLVGTLELLEEKERSLVKGFLINKFRGDISLLEDGLKFLESRTGKKVLGVLPFVSDLHVAEEDCVPESKWKAPRLCDPNKLKVDVILFPHISNSTDFESLEKEPDVSLSFLARIPGLSDPLPDLLILPGSKCSMSDLEYVRSSGFAGYIERCREARIPIIGICAGYQMLGKELLDPDGVESEIRSAQGLSLLELTTTFEREKKTVRVRALTLDSGHEISGYEIHMGRTRGTDAQQPLFQIIEEMGTPTKRSDGARSKDGLVWGTYLHGVFDTPLFRRDFLNNLRKRRGWVPLDLMKSTSVTDTLDSLAVLIRKHVDLEILEQVLNGKP